MLILTIFCYPIGNKILKFLRCIRFDKKRYSYLLLYFYELLTHCVLIFWQLSQKRAAYSGQSADLLIFANEWECYSCFSCWLAKNQRQGKFENCSQLCRPCIGCKEEVRPLSGSTIKQSFWLLWHWNATPSILDK